MAPLEAEEGRVREPLLPLLVIPGGGVVVVMVVEGSREVEREEVVLMMVEDEEDCWTPAADAATGIMHTDC